MNRRLSTAAAGLCITIAACTNAGHAPEGPDSGRAAQLHTAGQVTLTGTQLRYGQSVRPSAEVVYQPDVVLIPNGADAVRSVSADGLVWTLDAHAAGVDQLAVGKIMVATSIATGRVLHMTNHTDTEDMVLGPVGLTDVFRTLNIRSATPVPLTNPLYYAAPRLPGAETTDAAGGDGDSPHSLAARRLVASGRLALPTPPAAPIPTLPTPRLPNPPPLPVALPAPTTVPQILGTGEAETRPFLNASSLGAALYIQHGSGRFRASVAVHLSRPTASFVLDIENGGVKEASVRLHGAGDLTLDIDAAQTDSSGDFADKQIQIPLTLAIPIGGPAPLYLSITQGFLVTSQIVGEGSVQAHGVYRLIGDLYFGIRNGHPLLSANSMAAVDPENRHTLSLGIAANSVAFGWRVTAEVGVGLLGFHAGAWYKLGFVNTFTAAGPLDVLHPGCIKNAIILRGQFGIGYRVPDVVMKAVNLFLSVFGAPKIPASGGLTSKYLPLWQPAPAYYCPHDRRTP